MQAGTLMVSTYDGQLVALSILVAVITSYTAIDLAGRVTAAQGRLRRDRLEFNLGPRT
jgi:methyl-accepting chemotaxis protein PixJ